MRYDEILNNKFAEPAAIFTYKDDCVRIVDINSKFLPELWMNVSTEEYLSSSPEKIFDEQNRKIFFEAIRQCADTGEEQCIETWRHVFSNCCGSDKVCLKSRLILIEKSEDEAIIYESVRNITNEKRSFATLKDIESRYKQASEQINIYNWEYIIATKEMRPCYRCMRDLGLPAVVYNYPEPAIDMGIFPPDYADMYREMMKKIDEGIPEIEADIPLTVGRIPFRIKYTTSFNEDGTPVKAFGSATLISETELGKIKLDNRIIAMLALEYDCLFLADFINDSVKIIKQEHLLSLEEGTDCEGLLKKVAFKLKDIGEDRKKLLSDVKHVRTELFTDSDKREFVYKDDVNEKWIRTEYHVIERGSSSVDRLLVMLSYIDDLRAKKMDADRLIAIQKEELEDRQQMLLAAVDEANKANKTKTEFFSNMSHDIRTPMNAIMGFSKLAIEEIDNKEHLKDYLTRIDSASHHLLNLINDILDMSKIESGKMDLSLSSVCLKKLISDCAEMIRVKMNENGIDFLVDVDRMGNDLVECDKLRFNQVILNLLSNAYKFTPEGGSVILSGRLKTRGEKYIYEIRVKDTGIGMSEEFREHIWEAYSREKTETVHRTQGTGLGMAIVKNIVNMMRGTIDVKSVIGEGSEFIIELPMSPTVSDSSARLHREKKTADVMKKDYRGTKVLVVDDTTLNLKLVERMLVRFGIGVKTSESGIDAIQRVKNSKPGEISLILMDVMMPVMDGLETTRRIRALENPEQSSIPIIAMTANAFEADVKKALDAGMNAHIPKPFTLEELITMIDAYK